MGEPDQMKHQRRRDFTRPDQPGFFCLTILTETERTGLRTLVTFNAPVCLFHDPGQPPDTGPDFCKHRFAVLL